MAFIMEKCMKKHRAEAAEQNCSTWSEGHCVMVRLVLMPAAIMHPVSLSPKTLFILLFVGMFYELFVVQLFLLICWKDLIWTSFQDSETAAELKLLKYFFPVPLQLHTHWNVLLKMISSLWSQHFDIHHFSNQGDSIPFFPFIRLASSTWVTVDWGGLALSLFALCTEAVVLKQATPDLIWPVEDLGDPWHGSRLNLLPYLKPYYPVCEIKAHIIHKKTVSPQTLWSCVPIIWHECVWLSSKI